MNTIVERLQQLSEILHEIKVKRLQASVQSNTVEVNDKLHEISLLLTDADMKIIEIKSSAKQLCFDTWTAAMEFNRKESEDRYEQVAANLGMNTFKYLPGENRRTEIVKKIIDVGSDVNFVDWKNNEKRRGTVTEQSRKGFFRIESDGQIFYRVITDEHLKVVE